MVILTAIFCLLVLLVPLGWCFALAAQFKAGNAYWWHHSIIGWIFGKIFAAVRFVIRGAGKIIGLLPLVGRRLLAVAALLLCGFFMILSFRNGVPFFGIQFLVLLILGGAALLAYDLYAMGKVFEGAKQMAEGDLSAKITTRYLIGSYKAHAEDLNAVADVATVAAKKQLKSERMKTELITNVSHDIKTPLTSIINYVDLLQKPHTEEEGQQYLEVLDRQAHRMKTLLEDLMDMSKASTGDMAVELTRVDAGEAVNQALGEFADKLAEKGLLPLFIQPEPPILIHADGRLTWRVLSNLLGNAVKYAMPGTRLYFDLTATNELATLSLKNISREPLNVDAQELMERFVRGDASRNTEGSGLGLNIAKSLMEVQGGQLELTVDGDLFKVTLTFPVTK
jgi:signal transduction histidine kinase